MIAAAGRAPPSSAGSAVGRYYDPAAAVFLTVDPIVSSTNEPYGYVGEDPINGIDPNGEAISVADTGAAVFVAATFAWYAEKCMQNPACSGWGIPSWNLQHNGGSHLDTDDLPEEAPEGGARYVPPRWAPGGRPVGSRGRGFTDRDRNVWHPDRSGHGGEHWDVEHPDGKHTNVYPDGSIRGHNNFPRNPNRR